jgi:hypothetical protein
VSTALERKFLKFLGFIPGAESLDALLASPEFDGERRADFLLFDRKIIVEVKSLEVDTSSKVEAEMKMHRKRDDFPLIAGEVELQKVLRHLPDGKEINERIFLRTTRSVETATRSAQVHIENTARVLDLKESAGVLVLLNEGIDVLSPDVVTHRVAMLMHRRAENDTDRSSIAFAWLLFEGHVVTSGPAERTFPMVVLEGPRATAFDWLSEHLTYLQVAWAQFNSRPLIMAENATLTDLKIKAASSFSEPKAGDKIKRHKLWELRYDKQPYLRPLSDAEVLRHGRAAFERLRPYSLVGGPKASEQELESMTIAWNDFLCEARHRALDMRKMYEA